MNRRKKKKIKIKRILYVVEINFVEGVVLFCIVGLMRDINVLDNEYIFVYFYGYVLVGREFSLFFEFMMGFLKSNGSKGSFIEYLKYDYVE